MTYEKHRDLTGQAFQPSCTSQGQLIAEFKVKGSAIDRQQEVLQRFLSQKQLDQVGGINIINSADIDPETGHLWLCMNGSS